MGKKIKCCVHDCKHCNNDECKLDEIQICNCEDCCKKEATMCNNYKEKDE
ncbi:MAG: DUF1540 domain-containing protein [Bacilli bacterium]